MDRRSNTSPERDRDRVKKSTMTIFLIFSFAVISILAFALGTSAAEDGPLLTVIAPEEGLLTNNATLHVTGRDRNDGT